MHDLIALADQVHFDAAVVLHPHGQVIERVEIEVRAQFAIHVTKRIDVELGGDAGGVSHRRVRDTRGSLRRSMPISTAPFLPTNSACAPAAHAPAALEIAKRRAREIDDATGALLDEIRQIEVLREVRAHRHDVQIRIIFRQRARGGKQMLARNIHRHIRDRIFQLVEQQACFQAGAAAEFDQRGFRTDGVRHFARVRRA